VAIKEHLTDIQVLVEEKKLKKKELEEKVLGEINMLIQKEKLLNMTTQIIILIKY